MHQRPARDERTASGTHYTLRLGPRWEDISKSFAGSALKVDGVWAVRAAGGYRTSINVVRDVPSATLPFTRVASYGRRMASLIADERGLRDVREGRMAGERTSTHVMDLQRSAVRERQVIAVHAGEVYTITLAARAPQFADADDHFEAILKTWRWT